MSNAVTVLYGHSQYPTSLLAFGVAEGRVGRLLRPHHGGRRRASAMAPGHATICQWAVKALTHIHLRVCCWHCCCHTSCYTALMLAQAAHRPTQMMRAAFFPRTCAAHQVLCAHSEQAAAWHNAGIYWHHAITPCTLESDATWHVAHGYLPNPCMQPWGTRKHSSSRSIIYAVYHKRLRISRAAGMKSMRLSVGHACLQRAAYYCRYTYEQQQVEATVEGPLNVVVPP